MVRMEKKDNTVRVKSKLQPYTCHGSLNYNLELQNQSKHTLVLLNPSKTQPWVVLWPVFADVALWGPRIMTWHTSRKKNLACMKH